MFPSLHSLGFGPVAMSGPMGGGSGCP
jgi:hypothetical protein